MLLAWKNYFILCTYKCGAMCVAVERVHILTRYTHRNTKLVNWIVEENIFFWDLFPSKSINIFLNFHVIKQNKNEMKKECLCTFCYVHSIL